MNALLGFDSWEDVIVTQEDRRGGKRIHCDALYVHSRVWDNMKLTGFRGTYRVHEFKQSICGDSKKKPMTFDLLREYESRLPLQVKLTARRSTGKGTSNIDVLLQGFCKDPNGYTVIKIDCPDYKTEKHTVKWSDEK